MSRIYYKKNGFSAKKSVRRFSFGVFFIGIILCIYTFFPLLSWHFYFEPVFASSQFEAPIPHTTVLNENLIKTLIANATGRLTGVDYSNAQNWFPNYNRQVTDQKEYFLSIPKLKIKDAVVSTSDIDLSKHLVQYGGTATVPDKGNAVIFGHSTLPQLFDPKDYTKIFATAHTLKVGDEIQAKVQRVTYTYKINTIHIVDPDNTSIFTQAYDDSYLTLVTCTPPGTTWKRLIVKAKLQPLDHAYAAE